MIQGKEWLIRCGMQYRFLPYVPERLLKQTRTIDITFLSSGLTNPECSKFRHRQSPAALM